jgi:hypothetical protein
MDTQEICDTLRAKTHPEELEGNLGVREKVEAVQQ